MTKQALQQPTEPEKTNTPVERLHQRLNDLLSLPDNPASTHDVVMHGLLERLRKGLTFKDFQLHIRLNSYQCVIKTQHQEIHLNLSTKQASSPDLQNSSSIQNIIASADAAINAYITKQETTIGDIKQIPASQDLLAVYDQKSTLTDTPFNFLYAHGFLHGNHKILNNLTVFLNHLMALREAKVTINEKLHGLLIEPVNIIEKKLSEQSHPKENQNFIRKLIAEIVDTYSDSIQSTYSQFQQNKKELQDLINHIKATLSSLQNPQQSQEISDPKLQQILVSYDPQFEQPIIQHAYRSAPDLA